MMDRLDMWALFQQARFWWLDAMALYWLLFVMLLFVLEPTGLFEKLMLRGGDEPRGAGLRLRVALPDLEAEVVGQRVSGSG